MQTRAQENSSKIMQLRRLIPNKKGGITHELVDSIQNTCTAAITADNNYQPPAAPGHLQNVALDIQPHSSKFGPSIDLAQDLILAYNRALVRKIRC